MVGLEKEIPNQQKRIDHIFTKQYLRNLRGSLKGKGGLKVLLDERRKDKDRE